jgi:hypothetical protein
MGYEPRPESGVRPGAEPLTAEEVVASRARPEPENRNYARNVNLDYVGVENVDDIGRLLDAQAERMTFGDEKPQSFDEIRERVYGKQNAIVSRLMRDKPEALTAEQMFALDEMLLSYADEQGRLADKIASGRNVTAEDKLRFNQVTEAAVALQAYAMGKRRVAARTLNSMKMQRGVLESFDPMKLDAELSASDVTQRALIVQQMRRGGQDRVKINTALANPPGLVGSIVAWRTASLLSGAKTLMLNLGNNAFWGGMRGVVTKGTAGALGAARVGMGLGDANDRVYMMEVGAEIKGAALGIAEALDNSISMWYEGTFKNKGEYVSKFGDQKIEQADNRPDLIGDAVAKATRLDKIPGVGKYAAAPFNLANRALFAGTFGLLSATDEFFKTLHIRATANTLALRDGLNKGLEGDALQEHMEKLLLDPDAPLYAKAKEEAEIRTFTNQDDLLPVMQWLSNTGQNMRNKAPIMGIWLPFVRTPVAIVDRNLKYTPLAALSKQYRERLASGGADGDMARAELTLGVAFTTAALYMSMAGLMTGNGPSRREDVRGDAKRSLEKSGWLPNSVLIDDKYVQLTRGMDPITYGPMLVASVIEAARYAKTEAEFIDYLGTGTLLAASQIADGTYLMGMQGMFDLMSGRATVDTLARDFGTSVIPRAYQSTGMELYRHLYGIEGVPFVPKSDNLGDALRNQFNRSLTGEAATVRYWDGEAAVPGGGETMALWNTLMPIRSSYNYDSKGREYDMSTHALIIGRVPVSRPSSELTLDSKSGYSVELTALEGGVVLYDQLQIEVGKARREYVDDLVNSQYFQDAVKNGELAPNSDPAKELHTALEDGLKAGREEFIDKMEKGLMPGYLDMPQELRDAFDPDKRNAILDRMYDRSLTPEMEKDLRSRNVKGLPSRDPIDTPGSPEFGRPQYVPKIN